MYLFYNDQGLQHSLVIVFSSKHPTNVLKRQQDVALLYHEETLVGCNIFNAHEH